MVTHVLPSRPFSVREYLTADGKSPVGDWYHSLEPRMRARMAAIRERMEQGNFGDHKTVGQGVQEVRVNSGPGYRIYYGLDGLAVVILFVGGIKRTQGQDIHRAHRYWQDYKSRKHWVIPGED